MRQMSAVLRLGMMIVLSGWMHLGFASMSAEVLEGTYKDPAKYPLGCKNVGYRYQLNSLQMSPKIDQDGLELGDGQTLYFVYNRLAQPITLNQMMKDRSTRSVYLNQTIQANQWAVLATNQKEMSYICSTNPLKYGYGKVVSCADSIKVCEYTRVKFGLNNKGNYWLVSSANRGTAVGNVVRYGIIPR